MRWYKTSEQKRKGIEESLFSAATASESHNVKIHGLTRQVSVDQTENRGKTLNQDVALLRPSSSFLPLPLLSIWLLSASDLFTSSPIWEKSSALVVNHVGCCYPCEGFVFWHFSLGASSSGCRFLTRSRSFRKCDVHHLQTGVSAGSVKRQSGFIPQLEASALQPALPALPWMLWDNFPSTRWFW